MPSDLGDITWSDITASGLDTDLVRRQPNDLGGEEYVWESGDTKIAFGPAVDMEAGGTHGWDVSLYVRRGDSWEHGSQDWTETPGEALERVHAWARPTD